MAFQHARPRTLRDIRELAIARIPIQDGAVLIANVDPQPLDFGEYVPVHQQNIFPAIVVEIEKAASPADKTRVARQARGNRGVVELAAAPVVIQGLALVRKIAAENIQPAVTVIVGRGGAMPDMALPFSSKATPRSTAS